MADTLQNITIPAETWIELYAASSIAVGESIVIQNIGTTDLYYSISLTEPPRDSDSYKVFRRVDVITTRPDETSIWVFSPQAEGLVNAGIADKDIQRTRPFINPEFGGAMNQDASFGGTPVIIYDGGDTVAWTPVADQGTWDFTDTANPFSGLACASITSASDGDSATFSGAIVDGTNYASISMELRLETYSDTTNSIDLTMLLSGVQQGVSVNVVDYINATMLNEYQRVSVPLADLGIESLTFNEASIDVSRVSGLRPTFRFDEFEVEQSGGIEFTVSTDGVTDIVINRIRISMVNDVIGPAARNYDKLLGVGLFNGMTINRTSGGVVAIGRNLSNLYEFYSSGFTEVLLYEGETESMLIIEILFDFPITLTAATDDSISFGLSDDYSQFTLMTAIARGKSNG